MSPPTRNIAAIAKKVKQLHDRDQELSKARLLTKREQREVRLEIGALVYELDDTGLKKVAEISGYTTARLENFSFTRAQWPEGTYPEDCSYTVMEELARDPERFSKVTAGMSKRDARAARGGKVDTPSRWSADVKAEFVRQALADPDVAGQITDAVMNAAIAADAEAYERLRSGRQTGSAGHDDSIDAVGRLAARAQSIARMIDGWTEEARQLRVSEADKELLLGAVEPMLIAAVAAKNHIESTDAAFASLLQED